MAMDIADYFADVNEVVIAIFALRLAKQRDNLFAQIVTCRFAALGSFEANFFLTLLF